jgi:hypothetical protein
VFGPPRTAAIVREIPLPQVVVDALVAHLADAVDVVRGAPADSLRADDAAR